MMKNNIMGLGHFLVVLYHFIVTIYLAKLLFIYFCHLSTCVRWAWLNKNRKQNMRTKRRTGKNKQKTEKKRSINLIYLLCKPNRCARWRGGGDTITMCVCVCVLAILFWPGIYRLHKAKGPSLGVVGVAAAADKHL